MEEIYSIKDVGPYDLYSVVLIRPDLDPKRPLRCFHFSVGAPIPGTAIEKKVCACRSDTNMRVAGQLVDETMTVTSIEWRIPALALGKYQDNFADYRVTREDVVEFLKQAVIYLHAGSERRLAILSGNYVDNGPFLSEFNPDAIGSYGMKCPLGQNSFKIGRLEQFWVEVSFPKGAPMINGVLPLVVSLCGERARGVQ